MIPSLSRVLPELISSEVPEPIVSAKPVGMVVEELILTVPTLFRVMDDTIVVGSARVPELLKVPILLSNVPASIVIIAPDVLLIIPPDVLVIVPELLIILELVSVPELVRVPPELMVMVPELINVTPVEISKVSPELTVIEVTVHE